MENPTPCRLSFLDLPREVRLQVYPYVFLDRTVRFNKDLLGWTPEDIGILLACKKVHEELMPIFWQEIELSLPNCSLTSEDARWGLNPCRIVAGLSANMRSDI